MGSEMCIRDRSKYKKPALAEAMEAAFAAGDPPVGLGADARAAALAWVPPGFAAFDAGGVNDEDADGAAQAAEASTSDDEPATDREAAPVETGESPAGSSTSDDAAEHAAPKPHDGPSDGNGAETEAAPADGELAEYAAGVEDAMPPAPVNGHDAPPDPMAIPEFLRRVH